MSSTPTEPHRLSIAQRLSLSVFRRPRSTALVWLVVLLFGLVSYGTLLKREGFPAINTPLALAQGSYLVNDAARVNREVATPLSNYLVRQPDVKTVQISSFANFYTAQIAFKDTVDAKRASADLTNRLTTQKLLPAAATINLKAFEFGFTRRGDNVVISLYDTSGKVSTADLAARGRQVAGDIARQHLSLVKSVSIIDPFSQARDPQTGLVTTNQQSFDAYGRRVDGHDVFYQSVVIGIKSVAGADELQLDAQVQRALAGVNQQLAQSSLRATVSASNAPKINGQIGDLQRSLLEGLLVVLIVGSLIIAWRASIITVISMFTVIAATNGLLYLAGYSLNTITLFGLILGLSLIVDDTIIMVEALDSQRRLQSDPNKVVTSATGKVSAAMIAATSTSVLSFAPLLFVGGILGSFVRAIPITIISSLVISLIVALVFIPFFARFLLLGRRQLGQHAEQEQSASVEAAIARFISRPMLWAKGSTRKLFLVGGIALIIGGGFVGGAGVIFKKVSFNIFPPSKDDNQISTVITFKPNTSIAEAETISHQANQILTSTLGSNFTQASYYGQANVQSANLTVDLTDFKARSVPSPQIVKQLNSRYAGFRAAKVEAMALGVGPPASNFTVQVRSDQNRVSALKLANNIAAYLRHDVRLIRPDGTTAAIKSVDVGNSSIFLQKNAKQYVTVSVSYADSDTTTLFTLTKAALQRRYNEAQVASYDLGSQAVSYDAGQEQQNQDSFKTLAIAFPVLLLIIYIVLAFQFRSLIQPLLIFLAIPFSLFGITLGLYLTHNAFSFFAALGFFALIGLSLKNTILLTDYANQARRAGLGTVDAAHEALAQRFRPLVATSLTAVVSLIPLALSSPFWEGLAVVLIFGLLSSTLLVITVFPYYYLGSEYLRQSSSRLIRRRPHKY